MELKILSILSILVISSSARPDEYYDEYTDDIYGEDTEPLDCETNFKVHNFR